MAIKVKAKPKKITRAKIMTVDRQYLGDEVIDLGDITEENHPVYCKALGWYNYMHTQDEAREWLLEYMKKSGFERAQIADVRRCSKHKIPATIGWQARMMMNGNTLSEGSMNYFNQRLDMIFREVQLMDDEIPETEKTVVNIQDRVRAKIDQIITDCEDMLDSGEEFSVYDWMKINEVSQQAASALREFYEKSLADWEVLDPEVINVCGKVHFNKQKSFWTAFIADIDRFINNKRIVKVRKPREKKVKSAVDLIKGLKFQKEDPALKIVSVHPAEIVGCKQLWTYNTKYKKLTRYDAVGPKGIQVKGTTLIGFDVETASSKALRKPDISLQSLLSAGKVALRTFMNDLKTTESKPTGRINEQTILLRVIK